MRVVAEMRRRQIEASENEEEDTVTTMVRPALLFPIPLTQPCIQHKLNTTKNSQIV